jgi:hypothetical protein
VQNSAIIVPNDGLNGMQNLYLKNDSSISGINAYVYSTNSISTASDSNGFSISFWFDTGGTENKNQRLLDLCASPYYNSLFIDISGTNTIYSGYNKHTVLSTATNYVQLNSTRFTDIGTSPATITDTNTTVVNHLNKTCVRMQSSQGVPSAYLSIPINLSNQFTICVWYYDPQGGSGNEQLLSIAGTSYVLTVYATDTGYNNCYIYFANGSKTIGYNGRPIGEWVHYAFTIDQTTGGLTCLHINGVLQRSITTPAITSTNNILYLGKSSRPDEGNNGTNGLFYGLCTFSSILNATQITEVMNSTSSNNYTGFMGLINPGFADFASGWTVTSRTNYTATSYFTNTNSIYPGGYPAWNNSTYTTGCACQFGTTSGDYTNFMQNVMLYAGSYTFSIYAGGRAGGGGTLLTNYYNTNQVFQIYIDQNKVAQFTAPMLSDGITVAEFGYVTANFTVTESRIYEFHFRVALIGPAEYPCVAWTGATLTPN